MRTRPAHWLAALLVCAASAVAQAQSAAAVTEASVKAAFLYKFLGYIEWPPKAFPQRDNPISIGVIGADDIAEELQQITPGRRVDNRAIVVRRMREGDSVGGLNMLFIGRAASARIPVLAHMAQQRSIVVVTDSPGALEQGSVINFLSAEGRVRFEISVESADRSGVKLSSRLLAVAEVVRTGS